MQTGDYRRNSEPIPFVQRDVPRGTIAFWTGNEADIPITWRVCNGTRHTPDLRDLFIGGAGNLYAPDDTGGILNHMHALIPNDHSHTALVGGDINPGTDFSTITNAVSIACVTENQNDILPWSSGLFIMYDGRKF